MTKVSILPLIAATISCFVFGFTIGVNYQRGADNQTIAILGLEIKDDGLQIESATTMYHNLMEYDMTHPCKR